MKVKEESEKASLKLNIQKMKITASGPITSWQRDGKTRPPYASLEKPVWRSRNDSIQKLRSWHLIPSLHGKYMGKQWK